MILPLLYIGGLDRGFPDGLCCVYTQAEEQRKTDFFQKHGEHEEKRRIAHLR